MYADSNIAELLMPHCWGDGDGVAWGDNNY